MYRALAMPPCSQPFSPVESCTVPRPTGGPSTAGSRTFANPACHCQRRNPAIDPPIVMPAKTRPGNARRKDTAQWPERGRRGDIVFARIVRTQADDRAITPNGTHGIASKHTIARLEYRENARVRDTFEVWSPETAAMAADGADGKAT